MNEQVTIPSDAIKGDSILDKFVTPATAKVWVVSNFQIQRQLVEKNKLTYKENNRFELWVPPWTNYDVDMTYAAFFELTDAVQYVERLLLAERNARQKNADAAYLREVKSLHEFHLKTLADMEKTNEQK